MDWSKGSYEWQTDQIAQKEAERLLGEFSNKEVKGIHGDKGLIKAKYRLANALKLAGEAKGYHEDSGSLNDKYPSLTIERDKNGKLTKSNNQNKQLESISNFKRDIASILGTRSTHNEKEWDNPRYKKVYDEYKNKQSKNNFDASLYKDYQTKIAKMIADDLLVSNPTQNEIDTIRMWLYDGNIKSLSHHGIKGQHWGMRNGPPYPLDENQKSQIEKRKEQSGIKKINDTDDIVKKNTKIYRVANSDDVIDSRRKYVSVTDKDRDEYDEMFDMLHIDLNKPISDFVYEAKKDLRIANGKTVVEHMMNKYGNKDINTLMQVIDNENPYSSKLTYSELDNMHTEVVRFIKKQFNENISEITKKFKKEGYDAIVDPEDWYGFADYPLMLLDPKNSIKLRKNTPW